MKGATMSTAGLSLQVLGAAGGYPFAGHACSGYLATASGHAFLIDCGSGVATRLLASRPAMSLDGVLLSHLHYDHSIDLVPLGYALMIEWIKTGRKKRIPLALPPGGRAYLEKLSGLYNHKRWTFDESDHGPGYAALREAATADRDWMFEVFDAFEFERDGSIELDGIRFQAFPVDHTLEAVALRLDHEGKRLTYTGDTRFLEPLADFARDSDVLLAEACFSGSHPPGGAHMTPQEAGRLARLANARRLMLTHLSALEDAPSALQSASEAFGGDVVLAHTLGEIVL